MAKQEKKGKTPPKKKRRTPLKIVTGRPDNTHQSRRSHKEQKEFSSPRQEILGILFGALTLLLFVSLSTYHDDDLINLSTQGTTQNIAGIIGAIISDMLLRYFGYIAYVFPLITLLVSIDKFLSTPRFVNYGNIIGSFLAVFCLCALLGLPAAMGTETRFFSAGGSLGVAVATLLISYLNIFGSITVIVTGLMTSGLLLKKYLFPHLLLSTVPMVKEEEQESVPQILTHQEKIQKEKHAPKTFAARIANSLKKKPVNPQPEPEKKDSLSVTGYQLPPTTLLNKPPSEKIRAGMKQNLLNNSRILEEKLLDFGVEGQVVGVLPGPVITRYEFQPAAGVKVSRIVNLANDLALGMKALSIRIVAPVPGKDVIGIEVPNSSREIVYLRDLLESSAFKKHRSKLALAIGKDIGGRPYMADLAKMPHLLIAGATGSGKSVCLNSLICSILFHATPDEVRFIMVDPKMLELGVYDNIPHLLIPVVKDPQKAFNAMTWATEEMTRRYGVLAKKGVRNITQYNEAILDFRQHQHPNTSKSSEELLPYIVIIVDELADLKMVSSGIEKPITRLAQMARAVGIHLVLATQRPSVDIITGVIKANFPARVSFRVSSKVDSRTILDANGAEVLLGDGDMLFLLPGTSHIRRLHGSFMTEKEIRRLTTAVRKMGKPHFDQSVLHYNPDGIREDEDDTILYRKAAYLVVKDGEASVSMLRRCLKIGHSRASRLIDMMHQDGIVGGFKGTRPREILMTLEQLDEHFHDEEQ